MSRVSFRSTVLTAVLLLTGTAQACNVPVFRYALERWRPDRYDLVLFHRGELDATQEAALAPLYKAEERELVDLTLVNLDKQEIDDEFQQIWDAQEKPELPWLVVRYPLQLRIPEPVWAGKLDATVTQALVDSPARQEMAKRLMQGQTAVWIVLESGDKKVDDEAAALLEAQFKELEETLELPELTASPDDEVRSPLPIKVAFSALRVSRTDPKERLLVQMLLGSEPDLRERSDTMVFPVFGRGRALFALVGAGITVDNIADSAGFLVGPCSCQLKEFNPGFDILSPAEWDSIWGDDAEAQLVAQAEEAAAAEPGGTVPIPAGVPVAVAAVPAPAEPVEPAVMEVEHRYTNTTVFGKRSLLIGGVVLAGILALVSLIASRRSPARTSHDE